MKNRKLPIVELFLLALFVISFPLVAYVSTLPVARFRNEITQWGSLGIVVSWPGCDLKDKRVSAVSDLVKEELAGAVGQVSDGQSVYWTLRDDSGLSDEETRRRFDGRRVQPDRFRVAVSHGATNYVAGVGVDVRLYSTCVAGVVYQCIGHLYRMSGVQFHLSCRHRPQWNSLAVAHVDDVADGFGGAALLKLLSKGRCRCCTDGRWSDAARACPFTGDQCSWVGVETDVVLRDYHSAGFGVVAVEQ